jgi:hypothetical protein
VADDGLIHMPVTRSADSEPGATRTSLHRQLILGARFFAERARDCEERALKAPPDLPRAPAYVRHRSYVTGCILSAAAFLETSINELYLELHGSRSGERAPLPRRVLSVLTRFWPNIERAPVLHRYQTVLMVADAERFDERRAPFLEADTLLKLRDALIQCRPERSEARRRIRTLEQRLRTRVEQNPLADADSDWFPDLCLSAACADWAYRAADSFSAEFCRRMSLPARGLEWAGIDLRASSRAAFDATPPHAVHRLVSGADAPQKRTS